MPMTFSDAAAHVMESGRYKGQCIDKIAENDNGLLHLDLLRGDLTRFVITDKAKEAICTYLDDKLIAGELDRLMERN